MTGIKDTQLGDHPYGEPRIPERFRAICEFCKRDLNTQSVGIFQFVSGWVEQRAGGGGHAISLPERSHRFAHSHCVKREISGLTGQKSMFAIGDEPA